MGLTLKKISYKIFESYVNENDCGKLHKLLGDKEFTPDEIVELMHKMSKEDADWTLTICTKVENETKRRSKLLKYNSLLSVFAIIEILVMIIYGFVVKDETKQYISLGIAVALYIVIKIIQKTIEKRIVVKIS